MSARSTRVLLIAALAGSAALAGCGTNNDSITAVAPTPGSRILVSHVSPDAPRVNVTLDGATVGGSLGYPSSTTYLNVAGSSTHLVVSTNATPPVTLIDVSIPVATSSSQSVFACDSAAQIKTVLLADDAGEVPAGKAWVRFLNLAAGQPAMDLIADGVQVASGLGFRQVTPWILADAGSYDLEADSTSTHGAYALQTGMAIQSKGVYTLYLCGPGKPLGQGAKPNPATATLVSVRHR